MAIDKQVRSSRGRTVIIAIQEDENRALAAYLAIGQFDGTAELHGIAQLVFLNADRFWNLNQDCRIDRASYAMYQDWYRLDLAMAFDDTGNPDRSH
jgi:hypothetical protein